MTDKNRSHAGSPDRPTPVANRVAILGTGKMGSAIAARLSAAGFQLVLWNRTRSRAEALGFGTVADTPAAAAQDADFVITSLTGPEAAMAAFLGPDGALTAREGTNFIEMSTAGPDLVSDLATLTAAAGSRLVDAPIMGAPPVVMAGEATILVGGTDDDVAAVSAVLGSFGTVHHVGPLGRAARLKLVANSMLANMILAAAELQVAGEETGLDPEDVFFVLKRVVPSLESRRPGIVEGRYEPPLFALRDLRKDVGLALELFGRSDALTPLTHSSGDLLETVAAATPDFDITAVARPYRDAQQSTSAATRTANLLAAAAAR